MRAYMLTTRRPSFKPKPGINSNLNRNPKKEWYGDDWASLSDYVRRRDNYKCQAESVGLHKCNGHYPPPFTRLLHAHHIVPLPRGSNHPNNLITLCVDCHGQLHGKYLGKITERQKSATKNRRPK